MSHGLRYLLALTFCNIFPIIWSFLKLELALKRKCDEPLEIYIAGTPVIVLSRMVTGVLNARRMMGRNWDGQSFLEALGQIWNIVEGQGGEMEPSYMSGVKLNLLIGIIVTLDVVWFFVGLSLIISSTDTVCSSKKRLDAIILLLYQLVYG